jgi:hypothetical protein
MSFVIPDGATISEVKGRVQAVGVALLFTYAVNSFLSSLILYAKASSLLSWAVNQTNRKNRLLKSYCKPLEFYTCLG